MLKCFKYLKYLINSIKSLKINLNNNIFLKIKLIFINVTLYFFYINYVNKKKHLIKIYRILKTQ